MTITLQDSNIVTGFFEVATSKRSNPDAALIDSLTSFAPLLKRLQWARSNKAVSHVFRSVDTIEGADVYDFDGQLPRMQVSFQLGSENLTPVGGLIEVGSDTAALVGGAPNYFREQALLLARGLGMKLERSIFQKIVQTAFNKQRRWHLLEEDHKNPTDDGKAILAIVTPTAGELCGLYSPHFDKMTGDERFFELSKISGGNPYLNRDGVLVYGAYFRCVLGLLMANQKLHATLSNIDSSAKNFREVFPLKMSLLLDECLVNENTVILMNTRLRTCVANTFATHSTANAFVRFDERASLSICGIPVLVSSNFESHPIPKAEEDK